jgi:H+/Cl- antiporter ClcA
MPQHHVPLAASYDLCTTVASPSQIWAFILLAVVGGWVASVFTAFNTWLCLLRKKWSKFITFRILEVGCEFTGVQLWQCSTRSRQSRQDVHA